MKLDDCLYDFEVNVEEHVEREVEKKKKRKKDGKWEHYTEKVIESGEEKVPYHIVIKQPTRKLLEEADLFYSIEYNRFVKMGLLTAAQVAKKQIDVGSIFTKEQEKNYSDLNTQLVDKESMFLRILSKDPLDLTEDEKERRDGLAEDITIIRNQLQDYEYIKNSIYEHTADAKARNKVLQWWVLFLAHVEKSGPNEEDETVLSPMFEGQDYENKKLSAEELEDAKDAVFVASIGRITNIVTMWYWLGVGDKDKLEELDKEMEERSSGEETSEDEG